MITNINTNHQIKLKMMLNTQNHNQKQKYYPWTKHNITYLNKMPHDEHKNIKSLIHSFMNIYAMLLPQWIIV